MAMPELDTLIDYWRATLVTSTWLMPPTKKYMTEETIRQLEFLKTLHSNGRFSADKPKTGGD